MHGNVHHLPEGTVLGAIECAIRRISSGAAAHDLTDDQVTTILAREAKRRREAAAAFADAGRADHASAERAEEEVLVALRPGPNDCAVWG